MKKLKQIKVVFYIVVLATTFVFSSPIKAEMDPRIKALGLMAVYGTIGGALLGTAALAFDYSGRSVAKGASLGLYAGLLFGGFIVVSHMVKSRQPAPQAPLYQDVQDNPYSGEDEGEVLDGGYDDPEAFNQSGSDRWRYQWQENPFANESGSDEHSKFGGKSDYTLVYLKLVNYRF